VSLSALLFAVVLTIDRRPFIAERNIIDRGVVIRRFCYYLTWRGVLDVRIDPNGDCPWLAPHGGDTFLLEEGQVRLSHQDMARVEKAPANDHRRSA
jgi:hypothetical protein